MQLLCSATDKRERKKYSSIQICVTAAKTVFCCYFHRFLKYERFSADHIECSKQLFARELVKNCIKTNFQQRLKLHLNYFNCTF